MDETYLTPLDEAHVLMQADAEDEAARLGYFARLAAAELFILLEAPAEGDAITPMLAEEDGATYALVFDTEDRLTAFTGAPAPFAAMSGRVLAGMLYGQGIGLALNPEVAPSSNLLDADAVDWLAETLDQEAEEGEGQIAALGAPQDLPQPVLAALDRRLASMGGRATRAFLVDARYTDGRDGTLLAIVGAAPEAQSAITRAVSEIAAFSATPLALDVAFFEPTDLALVPISEVGLRFDLPEPEAPKPPVAPGSDPSKPPKLR
ncbi:SseB family protein [Pseudaestuariivita sp.]|uniref:SseB family protein n=1 Tax=Pseudaestuariivita sp. TaxID=2211669 RepID=UPI004059439C